MEPERSREIEGKPEAAPKRPYSPPVLRRLGTVRELTLTAGTFPSADAIPGSTTKVTGS